MRRAHKGIKETQLKYTGKAIITYFSVTKVISTWISFLSTWQGQVGQQQNWKQQVSEVQNWEELSFSHVGIKYELWDTVELYLQYFHTKFLLGDTCQDSWAHGLVLPKKKKKKRNFNIVWTLLSEMILDFIFAIFIHLQ